MSRPRKALRRPAAALAEFLRTEASGGVFLFSATALALIWANFLPGYDGVWETHLRIGSIDQSLQHWVNDGLMTIFFFVVGLEIKRELVVGELREPRVAALPIAAAVGGMVVPAAVYLAITGGGEASAGWAIPMATDIAFVVGALALLGDRAPHGLKFFLLTLAIVDDIGAIAIIALVYSSGIDLLWMSVALLALGLTAVLRLLRVPLPVLYLVPGVVMWFAMFESGIHPTIAGVALGLLTPTGSIRGNDVLDDLERWLHPVSSFVVIPIFALANAGLVFTRESVSGSVGSRLFWAVVLGLVVGKTVGIIAASRLGEKVRLGRLADDVTHGHILGGSVLAGIGFTVSLFITGLAFEDRVLVDQAKFGVLVGSTASAIVGTILLLRRSAGRPPQGE